MDRLSVIQTCFFLTTALYQIKDYDDGLHSTQTNWFEGSILLVQDRTRIIDQSIFSHVSQPLPSTLLSRKHCSAPNTSPILEKSTIRIFGKRLGAKVLLVDILSAFLRSRHFLLPWFGLPQKLFIRSMAVLELHCGVGPPRQLRGISSRLPFIAMLQLFHL